MIETQAKLILDTAGNLRIQFFQYNLLHRCSTTKKHWQFVELDVCLRRTPSFKDTIFNCTNGIFVAFVSHLLVNFWKPYPSPPLLIHLKVGPPKIWPPAVACTLPRTSGWWVTGDFRVNMPQKYPQIAGGYCRYLGKMAIQNKSRIYRSVVYITYIHIIYMPYT